MRRGLGRTFQITTLFRSLPVLDNVALAIADYGYVLENGRVVLEGAATELRGRREIQESYLGQASGEERRSYRALRHAPDQGRPDVPRPHREHPHG